ncbi:MAG TPA: HEAT repeat domain-containing protein, partial [Planctomycetota bacterium]|nr:HEAT repeat domain-containing protein [Planctomycetota bacterium]
LTRLSHASVTEVSEAALLALAISPGDRARAALDRLSAADAPESRAAARARDFAADPESAADFATGTAWLDLRWDAARRYGLVDGQPWRAKLQGELAADQEFLDALVYGAASELHRVGTADHFLELALSGGPPARLRAVVNAIPSDLDRMIEAGVWFPADQAEWAQLLFEIDDRRLESLTLDVLRGARLDPDLSAYASVLLVRAGNFEGLSMLELDIASSDPQKRERIAETLGGTHEPRYIDLLESLRVDEDARVRTAAMIAQMRLGNSLSVESVRGALADGAGAEHATLVEELARLANLPEISALLQEFFPSFSEKERFTVAVALAREGESRHAAVLRDALSEAVLRSPQGVHFVQALVRISANAEVSTLFEMFPLEDARAVNVEIALALCARREPAVLPLLRAALWQGPFVRSVLAGALIQHVAGTDALRVELDRPPKGAKPEDIRRVGFALGEWGGTGEVERLGRRRTAADPALQGAFLGALAARTH